MEAEALRLENVRFTYRRASRPALDGLSLTLDRGECLWLLGRSGSGRSTLALTPNRIVPLHLRGEIEGTIRVFGESVEGRRTPGFAGTVGQVFQDFESQIFGARVDLEVAFGCENLCLGRADMRRRVGEALEQVGLGGFDARNPARLSGGEKQRLVIAAALAMRPGLLVLDEPTTDLDPVGRRAVFGILEDLRAEGISLLLIEPEAEEATLGGTIGVLSEGRMELTGPAEEILARASRLESLGVRPPDLSRLAERLGLDASLDAGAMEARIRRAGWTVRPGGGGGIEGDERAGAVAGKETVRLEGVRHAYPGGPEVLRGIDLTFREGEFAAILGANGSGKTTLAQVIAGLLRPEAGGVYVGGAAMASLDPRRRGSLVGFVFQNPDHQLFAPSVLEEVCFGPRNFGASPEEAERAAREALATVGLEGHEKSDPFVMTRGDRQRVAVASVLAASPRVLVMDEPTTGLDHEDQQRMMALLSDLRRRGTTVVVVTHAIGLAAAWAGRIVVLDRGAIVADGPVREVLGRPGLASESAIRPPRIVELASRLGLACVDVDSVISRLTPPEGERR